VHWFWRAVIALVVVIGFEVWYFAHGWNTLFDLAYASFHRGGMPIRVGWRMQSSVSSVVAYLPILFVAFVTYGLLSYFLGRRGTADGETRCRTCGHILRGISEPRCSECGQDI
jgi:hypothetical protein